MLTGYENFFLGSTDFRYDRFCCKQVVYNVHTSRLITLRYTPVYTSADQRSIINKKQIYYLGIVSDQEKIRCFVKFGWRKGHEPHDESRRLVFDTWAAPAMPETGRGLLDQLHPEYINFWCTMYNRSRGEAIKLIILCCPRRFYCLLERHMREAAFLRGDYRVTSLMKFGRA